MGFMLSSLADIYQELEQIDVTRDLDQKSLHVSAAGLSWVPAPVLDGFSKEQLLQLYYFMGLTRATDLETKLATEAKSWGVLAGKLKSAGLGDPKAESGSIVPLVEKAVSLAMIKDPAGEIRKLSLQMADEKSRLEKDVASKSAQLQAQADELARRRPPAESLEFWRPLLQADLPDSKLTLEAVKDAQRVLAKAPADSPDAAKAKVVEALSEAAQGKLAEAKKRITRSEEHTSELQSH